MYFGEGVVDYFPLCKRGIEGDFGRESSFKSVLFYEKIPPNLPFSKGGIVNVSDLKL